ncbi:MAG TPA: protein kinase [Gemmataceae bacterium]|nr:protein kinase [Gemmataceae bacterium]
MTDTPSGSPSQEDIFAQFFEELDGAADPDAIVQKYSALHPHLAAEFKRQAAVNKVFDRAPSDPGLPGLEELPGFRLLREVDRGGMGVVYEAEQLPLRRNVAVKVRYGRLTQSAQKRFLREQHVLAQLHQTHIVPIHTAGQHGPWHYFAMAFIQGAALHHVVRTAQAQAISGVSRKTPTLAELAATLVKQRAEVAQSTGSTNPEGPWPKALEPSDAPRAKKLHLSQEYFRSVAKVIADAAAALQHAHDVHILHRDVKPSNIMVDVFGQCWLIDFSLARCHTDQNHSAVSPSEGGSDEPPELTQAGMGTPGYIAPEQYRGVTDHAGSDIWGLGVTLYELLTLHRAFVGQTPAEIQAKVLGEEPTPLEQLVDNIPADLAAICRKAMQKQSIQRYATAGEFGEDLRRWLRSEPTVARPARTMRRLALWARRIRGWATVIAGAVVALIVAAGGSLLFAEQERQLAKQLGLAAEQERQLAEQQRQLTEQQRKLAEQQRRERMLQDATTLRLKDHSARWSEKAWELARDTSRIGASEPVRDQAAAALMGVDARQDRSLKNCLASDVVFDREGKRILLGGTSAGPARIWDSTTDQFQSSELAGDGPVAFRGDGTALQVAPKDLWTFELWDVGQRRKLAAFNVGAEGKGKPEPLTPLNFPVMSVAPKGNMLAVSTKIAEQKWTLAIWETASGKLIKELPTKAAALQFAPDGSWLAIAQDDGHVTVRSLPEGTILAELPNGRAKIHCLTYAADCRRREPQKEPREKRLSGLLAIGDAGGVITIWDLATRLPKPPFRGSAHDIYSVAFSPDGMTVASCGRYDARLWDLATGRLLLILPAASFVHSVAFAPDGQTLAVASRDYDPKLNRVEFWRLENGRGLLSLRGLAGRISKVIFSPPGDRVAALTMDWEVGIWRTSDGRLLHVLEVPQGPFADNSALAFSADSKRFAFSSGSEAKLWNLDSGREEGFWKLPPGLGDTLAFTTRKEQLLSIRFETEGMELAPDSRANPEQHPRVCRVRDLLAKDPSKPLHEIRDFNWRVYATLAPADGRFFIVEGRMGKDPESRHLLKVFDSQSGNVLWSLPPEPYHHSLGGAGWSLDPAGKLLLLASRTEAGTSLNLLEMPTGKLIDTWEQAFAGLGPDARYCARSANGGIGLFRGRSTTPVVTLGIDSQLSSFWIPFNSAGTHLVWGNADGTVILCDIEEVRRRLTNLRLGW